MPSWGNDMSVQMVIAKNLHHGLYTVAASMIAHIMAAYSQYGCIKSQTHDPNHIDNFFGLYYIVLRISGLALQRS